MTTQQELKQNLNFSALTKSALMGAGIAIVLCSLILLTGINSLEYGFWVLYLYGCMSIAGMGAGAFFYLMVRVVYPQGTAKKVAIVGCSLLFAAAMYMSLIYALSLVGLWD